MNKVSKIMLVTFSVILLKSGTVHAQIVNNQVVQQYKTWTIKFNKPVKIDDTLKNKIEVFDKDHKTVPITISKGNSDSELLISPPKDGYTLGENYTLDISKDVSSSDNKSLPNDVNMNFSIDENVSNNANLVNDGKAASDGEWIYYSNSDGLYKIKNDGTGNLKLSKDIASYINVDNGWIYFINNEDRKVYKVQPGGTGPYKVSDVQVKEIYVQGDYIYYHNYNGPGEYVSKMKVDGTDPQRIGQSDTSVFQGQFTMDGDYIYCNAGGTVSKIKQDSTPEDSSTTILQNVRGPLYIYNNQIYYGTNSSDYLSKFNLFRANEDGSGVTNLNLKNLNCVNFAGNNMYYSSGEDNSLYKANLDGTDPVKIGNGIYNFYILENQIYYINNSDNAWHRMNLDGSNDGLLNGNINNQGNSSGNMSNGGKVASDGQWIYYSNGLDGGKLYRIKPDGTDNLKLSDKACDYINIDDDGWIYFRCSTDEYIYKIKSDGTGPYAVSNTRVNQLAVEGEWIYYHEAEGPNYSICKMKTDGSNLQKLCDNLFEGTFNLSGNCIYFRQEGSGINKMQTDGSSSLQIPCGAAWDYSPFTIDNNWVYYSGRKNESLYYIYRSKADGTGTAETVLNKNIGACNGSNNFLYYTYGNALYKSNADGTNEVKLYDCNQLIDNIYTMGNSIYFYTQDGNLYRINADGTGYMKM